MPIRTEVPNRPELFRKLPIVIPLPPSQTTPAGRIWQPSSNEAGFLSRGDCRLE
jgi:hypothetical protein